MKKLARVLAASLVGVSMMAGVAAADTTCTITGTGANSVNVCTDDTNTVVNATCVNNVYVDNRNVQTSTTGDGTVTVNTSGGGATSGNATNSNNAVVTIGAACQGGVTTSTPVTPTTATPASPVAGTPAATAPVAAPSVKSLPETGSSNAVTIGLVSAAILAGAAIAARFGLTAYRRLAVR